MEIRKLVTTLGFDVDGSGIDQYEQSIKNIKKTILEMKVVLTKNTQLIKKQVNATKAVEVAKKTSAEREEARKAKAEEKAKIRHQRELNRIRKEAEAEAKRDAMDKERDAKRALVDKRSQLNSLRNTGSTIRGIGMSMTATLTGSITRAMARGMRKSAYMESEVVGMGVMLKDPEKAKALMGDLEKLASKTPLKMQDLSKTSNLLLASGVQAEELLDVVRQLGDASRGDAEKMNRVAIQYSQIRLRGKAMWEDIRRIGEAGIPIIDELTEVLGVSKEELMELSRKGRISSEAVEEAFRRMTKEGGQFSGMMEAMSQTLGGKWSTTVDNYDIMLRKLMETVEPIAKLFMDMAIAVFQWISTAPTWFQVLLVGAGAFLSILGPIVSWLGMVAMGFAQIALSQLAVGKATDMTTKSLARQGAEYVLLKAKEIALFAVEKARLLVKMALNALTGPWGWGKIATATAILGAGAYGISKMIGSGSSPAPATAGGSSYYNPNRRSRNGGEYNVNVTANLEMPPGTPETQERYVRGVAENVFEERMIRSLQNANSNIGGGTQ